MNDRNVANLALLPEAEYNRQRLAPRPGDGFYLHLSDLALGMKRYETQLELRVLDFGCGGSPYRQWFPNAEYRRADLSAVPDIDYRIDANGRVNAPSNDFDLLLSTQVLEHCPDPAVYLEEARRLLRAGGRLLLSTHGMFEEHGCPFDFQRWTADGLQLALINAGFEVRKCHKLTTTGRALAFLFDRHEEWVVSPRTTFRGFVIRALRRMALGRRSRFHRLCDRKFPDCRVVDSGEPNHSVYIGLLVEAVKSAT
jgi:SAM-dependent methyltransferase